MELSNQILDEGKFFFIEVFQVINKEEFEQNLTILHP